MNTKKKLITYNNVYMTTELYVSPNWFVILLLDRPTNRGLPCKALVSTKPI